MSGESNPQLQWSRVDGIAVVEVLSREIIGPEMAKAMGEQIRALFQTGQKRILLNLAHVRGMSSTGFATLFGLGKDLPAAGGAFRICSMDPSVRFGADILSLGSYVPIHETEADALAAFAAEEGAADA